MIRNEEKKHIFHRSKSAPFCLDSYQKITEEEHKD